ncbi:MAG: hypothetical protein U0930_07820 [Pirellulales bacterium]
MARGQTASRTLQQPVDVDLLETLLKLELEVDGEAHLSDGKEGKSRTAAIKSKATQEYLETVAYDKRQPIAAARHYVNAKNDIWIAGKVISHKLRNEVSDIRALVNDGTWELYSPVQPLESREVNLLKSPINTVALEKILSTEPARTDSQWSISADDAKDLFNLDAVHQCTLVAKIAGVEKSTAKIEIEGSLQATANSVPTEIQVKGNAHAVLGSRCAIISWVGMSIKETREISENQPGFAVTARLQIVRQELKDRLNVTHQELATLAQQPETGNWLVRIESKTKFTSLASRNWIVFMDTPEDAVLRCVDKNQIIAQCNVIPLPKFEAGTQLSLEGLQEDMRTALGKSFEEFLESAERVTSNKLRLIRCEAAGKQEEVPIRWIYAHLSDDTGRRLLLTFTLAAEFAESFTGSDLQILDSLEFTSGSTESAAAAATKLIK